LRSKVIEMSESSTNDAHIGPEVKTHEPHRASMRVYAWLNQPLRASWCIIGWIAATTVFIVVVKLLGGPTQDDVSVSAYSTWSVAHGHLACVYSPLSTHYFPPIASPYTMIAPLYPLISGAVLGITHAWVPRHFRLRRSWGLVVPTHWWRL